MSAPLFDRAEAERSVLGSLLIEGGLLARVRDLLSPEDFFSEAHRFTYTACLTLADRGDAIDLLTVTAELERIGRLEPSGGRTYLSGLLDAVPDVENIETYARVVKDSAIASLLATVTRKATRDLESGARPSDVAANLTRGALALAPPLAEKRFEKSGIIVLTAADLLARSFPPIESVLDPWLRVKNLAMLYARRGVGKTWLSLSIGLGIASGSIIFREKDGLPAWCAKKPRRVTIVDGEMPGALLRHRVAQLIAGNPDYGAADGLSFIAADIQERGLPTLAKAEGQRLIEDGLVEGSVLILDNVSTLMRGLAENEADGWEPVQEWLLDLRRKGVTVLLDHHAGRNGQARGTSKREDVLDTVISLKSPEDYDEEDGARFEVHFEKSRGLVGSDVTSFEAELTVEDQVATWTTRPVGEDTTKKIVELRGDGKSYRKIAEEVGLDHATVLRRFKKAERDKKRKAATEAR